MSSSARSTFEAEWERLLALPPSSDTRMRVHQLPTATSWGNVALAVDHDGVRHLLVPILSSTRVRSGLDGPGLMLRKRVLEDDRSHTTFAALSCLRPELSYLFDDLCSDVVVELDGLGHQPMKAVYQVVDRWRSLFDRPAGVLSDEAAAGLYGELLVLRRLLEADASAHLCWAGPHGARHDFRLEDLDVEVKATSLTEGRTVRIHGLDQLEASEDRRLLLAVIQLEDRRRTGGGTTLLDLAKDVLAFSDDEAAVLSLLASVGYVLGAVESNDSRAWTVTDERWYDVDDAFPRLTRAALAAARISDAIRDVDYCVDLAADSPSPVPSDNVKQLLSKGAHGLS
ncbi:PD-(D/E)XK motif protein [Cellulosimicrobium sp. NPDC057127]|uniref:PD-(D/E)XK motif protein n=1 Tax=Cellulosimicrobium sp. NPDC057127 TaxID=3346026 RepID=UPI0036396FA9